MSCSHLSPFKSFTHILPLLYEYGRSKYGISKYGTNAYMSINKMAKILSHFIGDFREKP